MKIGIDARLYSQTGIGRYIRNLIAGLSKLDKNNQYVVFLCAADFKKFKLPGSHWKKVKADIRWHSLAEQLKMPLLLYRHQLDLVHFPYFNVPVLYRKPFIVTLHDLTIWKRPTGKATTRPLWYYYIKKIGYLIDLYYLSRHAKKIITISQTVKKDIIKVLKVDPDKISVIYEAVDKSLFGHQGKPFVRPPYLLTVGNFYPHKNISRLIFAWQKIVRIPSFENHKLILTGPKDFFYQRLKKELKEKNLLGKVQFVLNPSDERLAILYQNAALLVFPSLAEGFGLPGLEAMALGCPVVCSDLPVFKEIYRDVPLYFDRQDIDAMTSAIKKGLQIKPTSRKKWIVQGRQTAKQYSWDRTAKETLAIYENCLSL